MAAGEGARGAKPRRAREQSADPMEALFASLTIAEKRSALRQLGGSRSGKPTPDAAAVEEAIRDCGRDVGEIVQVLRGCEAGSIKKHFMFGTASGDLAEAVTQARTRLGQEIASSKVVLSHVEERRDGMAVLLLERTTHGHDWVTLPTQAGYEEVRGRRPVQIRHATTVRVNRESGRTALNYPGLPTGVDYDYEAAIGANLECLGALGLHVTPLPARECIRALIAAKGRRVLPVRGDLITPEGVLKMRSRVGKASIQQLIARLVEAPGSDGSDDSDAVDLPELLERITDNLGKHSFETIGLLWTDERVLTRVEFNDAGSDFLFIWGDTEPSLRVVDEMVGLLYDLAEGMASAGFEEIWRTVAELQNEALLLPGEFRARFKAARAEVDSVLLEAVKLGLLEPVFRLKASEDVLEALGQSDWTPNVGALARRFVCDEPATTIDGTESSNISVAFRRIRSRAVPR